MKNWRAAISGCILTLLMAGCSASGVDRPTAEALASYDSAESEQGAGTAELIDLVPLFTSTANPSTAAPTPSPAKLATETAEPIGECREYTTGLVRCRIQRAFCSYHPSTNGKPTFCNDGKYPNYNFTYLVWGNDVSGYHGRCLILEGRVEMYKGKAEITSEDDSAFVGFCDGE